MFRILALSGGGYLGLFSAVVLSELERRRRAPIHECFDLVAGTSVGGLIALGLSLGKTAEEICTAIESLGKDVFPTRVAPRSWASKAMRAPAGALRVAKNFPWCLYGDAPLRKAVQSILGNDTTLAECIHPVIIPTVCLTLGRAAIFRGPNDSEKLVDVAMATTAAPTYFPLANINGAQYADGGLVANCPDLIALHEAEFKHGPRRNDIYVLSIGTTETLSGIAAGMRNNIGIAGWMANKLLVNMVMASQQGLVKSMMREALRDRYLVIDEALSADHQSALQMDNASNDATKTMKIMAQKAAERAYCDINLKLLLKVMKL